MKLVVCLSPKGDRAGGAATHLAASLDGEVTWVRAMKAPRNLEPSSGAFPSQPQTCIDIVDARLEAVEDAGHAAVVAALCKKLSPAYVFTGVAGDVHGRGLFPAALAHALGWPLISHVSAVAIGSTGALEVCVEAAAERLLVSLQAPTVLACVPIHPSREVSGVMPPHQVLSLDDLEMVAQTLRHTAEWSTEPLAEAAPVFVTSAESLWHELRKR